MYVHVCRPSLSGSLFEGKLHWELFCQDAIRAPLSKIAFAANAALGRHQIEFVYVYIEPTCPETAKQTEP